MTCASQPIPFESFATWTRVPDASPLFYCEPPEWAAAAHAVVVGDTVHYLWARRTVANSWSMMHSQAPVADPAAVVHDPRNPIFTPSADPAAWDCDGLLTPQVLEIGGVYYMLYAGLKGGEWQSGLAAAT